ncbi:hypothetical protein BDR22DRAFT_887570 [Usnea florida]
MPTADVPPFSRKDLGKINEKAGTSTPVGRAIPERWVVGKAYSANYYYDEITDDALPPKQIDLSDYWVVKVVKAGIGPTERQTFWPAVFTKKMIRASYINKGTASKVYDVQSRKYHYEVIFGTYEMHGSEGRLAGYVCNVNRAPTSKSLIGLGRECKKGSTMNGFKDPISRAAARRSNEEASDYG